MIMIWLNYSSFLWELRWAVLGKATSQSCQKSCYDFVRFQFFVFLWSGIFQMIICLMWPPGSQRPLSKVGVRAAFCSLLPTSTNNSALSPPACNVCPLIRTRPFPPLLFWNKLFSSLAKNVKDISSHPHRYIFQVLLFYDHLRHQNKLHQRSCGWTVPYPWKCSGSGWGELWTTWSSGRHPRPWQGVRNRLPLKSLHSSMTHIY